MTIKRTIMLLLALAGIALVINGCEAFKAKPAALSDEQVGQATENILVAIEEDDYQSFVQDFSDPMKSAFTEDEFNKLRDMLQETSGNYISMNAPDLSNKQGYAIYRILCKFDLEDVIVTVTFKVDGNLVEGLFFDSANLRKLSQ